ncbi:MULTISPECIES: hypothetical protein [Synechococcales]|uniref:hypothetical protein n=1 Tax=Synechococcales TaxID=1890424 RepID=UPI0020CEED95|nr:MULTISPECIES: hypothetical protein [Synechococcales]MCP9793618.1 hypothetical protein [Vulcanococcus limneticus MW73D5]MCP9833841.1 hypothetical protein [Cyanobium sp. La Preciosa 7G6]MCP9936401.1 hypothetical protein [Cyanobium sp. Aljojuca 7A6]
MSIESLREVMIAAGTAAQTDKISHHHYERPYSKCLQSFREQEEFAMLEIGYGTGAGVNFWRTVFPGAFVYCFDRDYEGGDERLQVMKVDQSDLDSLRQGVGQIAHPIDLIIDDGSHHPSHQLLTFSYLFQELLRGEGIYAIEDIETSYWRNGSLYGYATNYGLNDPWSTMEAFKTAADYVNKKFLCDEDKNLLQYRMMSIGFDPQAVGMIDSIRFSQNCILIDKSNLSDLQITPYGNEMGSRRFF